MALYETFVLRTSLSAKNSQIMRELAHKGWLSHYLFFRRKSFLETRVLFNVIK